VLELTNIYTVVALEHNDEHTKQETNGNNSEESSESILPSEIKDDNFD